MSRDQVIKAILDGAILTICGSYFIWVIHRLSHQRSFLYHVLYISFVAWCCVAIIDISAAVFIAIFSYLFLPNMVRGIEKKKEE